MESKRYEILPKNLNEQYKKNKNKNKKISK